MAEEKQNLVSEETPVIVKKDPIIVRIKNYFNGRESFNLFGSNVAGPWLGIDIVLNIVLMLFMFFATIEMKSYSLTLGYTSVCLGAFQIVRIFMLPLSLLNSGNMKPAIFTTMLIMYVLSGTFAILAGFLSVYRGTALRKYLKTVKPIENEKVGK